MTAQTAHAHPHAQQGDSTAQTAQTAHPPVRGAGSVCGVVAPRTPDPLSAALLLEAEQLLRCATRDAQTAAARLLHLPWPDLTAEGQPTDGAGHDDQALSLERVLTRICPMPLGARAIEDQAARLNLIVEPADDWPEVDDDEPPADWAAS